MATLHSIPSEFLLGGVNYHRGQNSRLHRHGRRFGARTWTAYRPSRRPDSRAFRAVYICLRLNFLTCGTRLRKSTTDSQSSLRVRSRSPADRPRRKRYPHGTRPIGTVPDDDTGARAFRSSRLVCLPGREYATHVFLARVTSDGRSATSHARQKNASALRSFFVPPMTRSRRFVGFCGYDRDFDSWTVREPDGPFIIIVLHAVPWCYVSLVYARIQNSYSSGGAIVRTINRSCGGSAFSLRKTRFKGCKKSQRVLRRGFKI